MFRSLGRSVLITLQHLKIFEVTATALQFLTCLQCSSDGLQYPFPNYRTTVRINEIVPV